MGILELVIIRQLTRSFYSHGNSIDKFEDGDYLYSGRHVNTIYRINHTDKSVVWRLGGKLSDFKMDFNFSSQHHALVQSDDGSKVRLTFLDNAADDLNRQPKTSKTSSAKLVELDTDTMTATVRLLFLSDLKVLWVMLLILKS